MFARATTQAWANWSLHDCGTRRRIGCPGTADAVDDVAAAARTRPSSTTYLAVPAAVAEDVIVDVSAFHAGRADPAAAGRRSAAGVLAGTSDACSGRTGDHRWNVSSRRTPSGAWPLSASGGGAGSGDAPGRERFPARLVPLSWPAIPAASGTGPAAPGSLGAVAADPSSACLRILLPWCLDRAGSGGADSPATPGRAAGGGWRRRSCKMGRWTGDVLPIRWRR